MKEKDTYTIEELYDNLTMPMSVFSRRAEITEGTLTRIKRGYQTRRSTANKLLETFSKVYNLELSLDNVTGIHLEEPAQDRRSSRRRNVAERELPEGCILARHFAEMYEVAPETFRDHYMKGLGPKGQDKEKVAVSSRPKPGREKETEYYLTPEQQATALNFWSRHGVQYQASPVQGGSTGDAGEDIDPAA